MIGISKNRVNPIPFTDIIVNLFKRPNLAQFFFFSLFISLSTDFKRSFLADIDAEFQH